MNQTIFKELAIDLITLFVGYLAQIQYTHLFDTTTPTHSLIRLHVNYEVLYYTWRLYTDSKERFHHILSLMYIYFGWKHQMGISKTIFICTLSNPLLTVALYYENFITKFLFIIMFVYARIYVLGSLVIEYCISPYNNANTIEYCIIVNIILILYTMQWFWLFKMYEHISKKYLKP